MNISKLRSLLAIHAAGSFSAAADRVHLSQSTLSIQMKHLAEDLGAPLFVPGKRPATLTPFGQQVITRARRIVAEAEELRGLAKGDETGGRIAIGFVPTTLQTLLPRVLSRLRRDYPDLGVAVRSGFSDPLARDVANQELDFAFITSSSDLPGEVSATLIAEEPLVVIAPPDASPPRNVAEALRGYPYVAFSGETRLGRQIAAMLEGEGHDVEEQIALDSIDAIEKLVALGLGVSIVPQRLLAPALADRLHCLPFGGRAGVRRLILATPRGSRRHSLHRAMLDALQPEPPTRPDPG
jgi:DNA-binding transcriptional LysR family regulator